MPYRDPENPLYGRDRLIYLWFAPAMIALLGVLGAASRVGVYFGGAEILGRVLMGAVAIAAVGSHVRPVRFVLFWLMAGGFLGRSFALLTVPGGELVGFDALRSAVFWFAVWGLACAALFQEEIICTYDEHHRGI